MGRRSRLFTNRPARFSSTDKRRRSELKLPTAATHAQQLLQHTAQLLKVGTQDAAPTCPPLTITGVLYPNYFTTIFFPFWM